MISKESPIGFFDSGVGGLSVLKHAMTVLPNEKFLFYGDNKNAPYGTKSEEEIKNIIAGLEDKSLPSIMKHFKANYTGKVDMSLVNRLARG